MKNPVFIVLFLFFMNELVAQTELSVGTKAPTFQKVTAAGTEFDLNTIDSELILLDFWAGWCKPCIHSIKTTLLPLREKYDESQLKIVGISYDKTEEQWKKSMDRFDVPWTHIYDANDALIHNLYRISAIPTYYLIDKNGKIVAADISSSRLTKTIDRYFDK